MNTKHYRRVPLLVGCLAILLGGADDVHVGCSPTLTCELRPERFAPYVGPDAGPQPCDEASGRCFATEIAAGEKHTCALTDSHEVFCWGDNAEGQRGVPNGAGRFALAIAPAKSVVAGGRHTCALLEDDTVACWGRRAEGQLGGPAQRSPSDVPTVAPVVSAESIDAGALHTCVVSNLGVMCWGSSRYGQAGRMQADTLEPALVEGTRGAVEVACGVRHTCARLSEGQVVCWGELIDDAGQPYVSTEPVIVPELDDAIGLSAGGGHTCARRRDASLVCWGHNDSGQLGTEGPSRAQPVTVAVGAEALRVAAGGGEDGELLFGHTCASTDDHVTCWGHDAMGQLGDAPGPDRASPRTLRLRESDSGLERLDLGAAHSCGIGRRGSVWCWGDDSFGQLGRDLNEDTDSDDTDRIVHVDRFGRR